MQCPKCRSQENIEIKGKIFCSQCGSLIYEPSKSKANKFIPEQNIYIPEHKVIESDEIAHPISVSPLRFQEQSSEPIQSQAKIKEINFKPFLLSLTIISIVFFIILTFVFEPFINLRAVIFKYTQSVSEIDYFKEKIKNVSQEAKNWDSGAYLVFIDMTKNASYEPINFSIKDTYHCIFSSPNNKKEVIIFFPYQKQDGIAGNIKINASEIKIPLESKNYSEIQIDKVNYLPDELLPIVEINGLNKFLEEYENVSLSTGPVLVYSNKYQLNYWFYIYETPNKKHKFTTKINAETGKILEVSQR